MDRGVRISPRTPRLTNRAYTPFLEESMSRRITRTFRGAFAALVAVSLTFGARSALASPPAAEACAPGVFTCSSVADCNAKCPYPFGNLCRFGCCTCST
jgi:hypothetical protein